MNFDGTDEIAPTAAMMGGQYSLLSIWILNGRRAGKASAV